MVPADTHRDVTALLDAVRARPCEFPIAQLSRINRRRIDVSIEPVAADSVAVVASRPDPVFERLTAREHEVATLVAAGFSNAQVASTLYISIATVKDHMHAVLARTGFDSRSQMIAAWYGGMQRFTQLRGRRAP